MNASIGPVRSGAIMCLLMLQTALASAQSTDAREVTFATIDGVRIYGDLHAQPGRESATVILLFHQGGGDARGEYGPIIPRLQREGYSVLAIDQRSGGSRFGGHNRTVAELGDRSVTYCDAYADLEAALRFLRSEGFNGKLVAWGSSYSATLAMRLGVDHPREVASVVAFSPAAGAPMQACQPEPYITHIRVPLLVLRPASEMASENAQRQVDLLTRYHHTHYVAERGVHGSSMLVAARVNGDVEPQWQRVLAFILTSAR